MGPPSPHPQPGRLDALRGLVAGTAAAISGASFGSGEADARLKGKKRGPKKGRKGGGVRAQSVGENGTPCACRDDLSPKQCPEKSAIKFTCTLCDKIVSGSVQVLCTDAGPTCICQPTGNGRGAGCDIRTSSGVVNVRPGQPVPQCSPERCPASDCNDGAICTKDFCNKTTGFCEHAPDDRKCDDGNVCTADVCDPTSDEADERGCVHRRIDCDDKIVCTVDGCDPKTGCTHTPDDAKCDDNAFCTVDVCDPDSEYADEKGCVNTKDDSRCDDGVACTRRVRPGEGVHEHPEGRTLPAEARLRRGLRPELG